MLPPVWLPLRFATGFCFSGLIMVMESWLNESTGKGDRARLLSIYATIDMISVTAIQF